MRAKSPTPTGSPSPSSPRWTQIAVEGDAKSGFHYTEAMNLPGGGCLIRTRTKKLHRGMVVSSEAVTAVRWNRVEGGQLVYDPTAEPAAPQGA